MKGKLSQKSLTVLGLILGLLTSPLTPVVLLRGTSAPQKRVKTKVKYPNLVTTHSESDKLRINGWKMEPSDVERIRNEGRRLKVTCKFLFLGMLYGGLFG
jgi:hypothetical protein